MAKNPNIFPVDTSYDVVNTLNQNFESLQEGFENTLSRDGSLPNNMLADLDMDGNDILNVGGITAEDYTLNGVSLNEAIETAATNAEISVDAADLADQKAVEASNSASSALVSRQAAEDAQQAAEAAQEAAEDAQALAEAAQEAAEEAALEANVALGPLEGGLTGQLLQKASNTDFDYQWSTIAGSGDMVKLVYDPTDKNADAFSMGNMVETSSAKILTSAERTKLTGIQAGAQVNTVTSVAGKTGAVTLDWDDFSKPAVVAAGATAAQARSVLQLGSMAMEDVAGYQPYYHVMTASGTWTKPAGYPDDAIVEIEAWGGGGSGGRGPGGGGGGGGYMCRKFRYVDVPSSVSIVIGSGGAAITSGAANGNTGGTTTVGTLLAAYGGGGGSTSGAAGSGGGGGGSTSAGSPTAPGLPGGGAGGTAPGMAGGDAGTVFGGGAGGSSISSGQAGRGGAAVFGGGGGGGGSTSGAAGSGGASAVGGAGGSGGAGSSNSGTGTAPGGGGGGAAAGSSGAGARGEARIWIML